ncbi:hypothetical protein VZT92_013773 [Zoarces viviparus]|uniref:Uncharacterized protein n=1 Tax=Zoarces viviparus TaxID=48416 RepID=A0AAW1F624_ZOAVI
MGGDERGEKKQRGTVQEKETKGCEEVGGKERRQMGGRRRQRMKGGEERDDEKSLANKEGDGESREN